MVVADNASLLMHMRELLYMTSCYSISTYYLSSYLVTSCLYVFREKVQSTLASMKHMILFVWLRPV